MLRTLQILSYKAWATECCNLFNNSSTYRRRQDKWWCRHNMMAVYAIDATGYAVEDDVKGILVARYLTNSSRMNKPTPANIADIRMFVRDELQPVHQFTPALLHI